MTPPVLKKRIYKGEHLYLEIFEGALTRGRVEGPAVWRVKVRRREARRAVVRNRWRRRIHEIVRQHKAALLPGSRMSWGLIHLPPERLTPKDLEKEIQNLLRRSGILKES